MKKIETIGISISYIFQEAGLNRKSEVYKELIKKQEIEFVNSSDFND